MNVNENNNAAKNNPYRNQRQNQNRGRKYIQKYLPSPDSSSINSNTNDLTIDKISETTISQLDEQERLLEFTQRKHKFGPIRTLIGVVGNLFNQTGPGKLIQRISEANAKAKAEKLATEARHRT
jgi:hypothetical protein